jgi:NitT/TauT family transport system substrate-binding protein/putative hydroxymethylpyrimidine transport system substrate-binding protein
MPLRSSTATGRRGRRVAVVAAVVAGAVGACAGDAQEEPGRAPRPVTVGLDFTPNAVHAGVLAAAREGEDTERGVALEVQAPASSTDSLRLLESGRADLAIVDIHDLGLARERGEDVVGVGAIVQRPLAAVIATGGIERPRDLEGARVGVTGLPSDDAVLRAIVQNGGGDPAAVDRVTIGFSAVRDLAAGNVDAATAFWNAEGVTLRERGIETTELRVDDFGAPPYPELVLAARAGTVAREPETVEAVLGAVRAGTEAALADREAAAAEVARLSAADQELVAAQLDAVAPALRPPIRLDREALERWARFDRRFGILRRTPDVQRAFALDLRPAE